MREARRRSPEAVAPGLGPENGRFVRSLILVRAPDNPASKRCYHH